MHCRNFGVRIWEDVIMTWLIGVSLAARGVWSKAAWALCEATLEHRIAAPATVQAPDVFHFADAMLDIFIQGLAHVRLWTNWLAGWVCRSIKLLPFWDLPWLIMQCSSQCRCHFAHQLWNRVLSIRPLTASIVTRVLRSSWSRNAEFMATFALSQRQTCSASIAESPFPATNRFPRNYSLVYFRRPPSILRRTLGTGPKLGHALLKGYVPCPLACSRPILVNTYLRACGRTQLHFLWHIQIWFSQPRGGILKHKCTLKNKRMKNKKWKDLNCTQHHSSNTERVQWCLHACCLWNWGLFYWNIVYGDHWFVTGIGWWQRQCSAPIAKVPCNDAVEMRNERW